MLGQTKLLKMSLVFCLVGVNFLVHAMPPPDRIEGPETDTVSAPSGDTASSGDSTPTDSK